MGTSNDTSWSAICRAGNGEARSEALLLSAFAPQPPAMTPTSWSAICRAGNGEPQGVASSGHPCYCDCTVSIGNHTVQPVVYGAGKGEAQEDKGATSKKLDACPQGCEAVSRIGIQSFPFPQNAPPFVAWHCVFMCLTIAFASFVHRCIPRLTCSSFIRNQDPCSHALPSNLSRFLG
eukprot:scaffold231970_cov18-Tisochrysis_lutea.AAC.1